MREQRQPQECPGLLPGKRLQGQEDEAHQGSFAQGKVGVCVSTEELIKELKAARTVGPEFMDGRLAKLIGRIEREGVAGSRAQSGPWLRHDQPHRTDPAFRVESMEPHPDAGL